MFLSPAKTLTEPLLILLALAIVACAAAWRRAPAARRGLAIALAALALLWCLSLGVVADLLGRTLTVDAAVPPSVDAIVVLAAGYIRGSSPSYDMLNPAALERTIAGVELWKRRPAARLIFSGASRTRRGLSLRPLVLMREEAIRRGVPPGQIVIEGMSTNTREHPRGLRRLEGIRSDMTLAVVTSHTHTRRSMRAFRRYFTNAVPHPASDSVRGTIANDFVPSAVSLRRSTICAHEWIGIAWYAFLDAFADRDSDDTRTARLRR